MNTHDIELPPLPTIDVMGKSSPQIWFTAAEVDALRRAAIEADRKRRGEPDAVAACHAVRPYIDSIVCYASTMDEHDGNRVAKMVEDVCAAHPQPAEPVKDLSDADAKYVQDFINCDGMGAMIVEGTQYSAVVRALLARYGNNQGESNG